jgi:hypothetical protein
MRPVSRSQLNPVEPYEILREIGETTSTFWFAAALPTVNLNYKIIHLIKLYSASTRWNRTYSNHFEFNSLTITDAS